MLAKEPSPGELGHARMLVVNHDSGECRLLKRLLKRAGYTRVATSANARNAIRLQVQLCADVVFLDGCVQHPGSLDAMEQLRSVTPPNAHPPIVVMTGDLSTPLKEQALARGAKGFLARPLDYSEVVACTRSLLETRMLHHELGEITHGIGNSMSVIRNYADFLVSGIDRRIERGEQDWLEIRKDAEEIRLAAERSAAFANRARSVGDGGPEGTPSISSK